MLFGSVPRPPNTPVSWTSTQSAGHSPWRGARAGPAAAGAEEGQGRCGQHDDRDQVDRETVRRHEPAEAVHQAGQGTRLGRLGHVPTMPASVPGCRADPSRSRAPARPAAPPCRPGTPRPASSPAEPGRRPGAVGQRDQRAGHAVQQGRARRAGQQAQPGGEHAERLAEHPDHKTPGHPGQPGQPGPPAAGHGQHPHADAELDPYRGGPGLHRVEDQAVPPQLTTYRTQAGDPAVGLITCGEADHRGLGLQQAVEHPQQAEPDAQHGRQAARPGAPGGPPGPACRAPAAAAPPGSHARTVIQANPSSPKISSAMIP